MAEQYTLIRAVWSEHKEQIKNVRKTVFVIEQGIDPEIEWDGRDHLCQHVIAFSPSGEPIATGRLLPSGHAGRMSVLPSWRRKGIGGAILLKLVSIAQEGHLQQVYLNSQVRASDFYHKLNFVPEGPIFMEAGIPHQRMRLLIGNQKRPQ